MFKTDRQSHGSPWYPGRLFIKMTMLLAWSTLHHSTAFTAVGESNSVSLVGKGSMSDNEEKKGGIRAIFRGIKAKEESIVRVIQATKTVADKTLGLSTASYGLSLVAYGANFPTQMRVLTIAHAGGFNKIRRASLARGGRRRRGDRHYPLAVAGLCHAGDCEREKTSSVSPAV